MIETILLVVSLFDVCITGAFAAVIVEKNIRKNIPLGKILNVLVGIAAGGAYTLFCFWLLKSEVEIIPGLIFLFAPPLLLLVVNSFVFAAIFIRCLISSVTHCGAFTNCHIRRCLR